MHPKGILSRFVRRFGRSQSGAGALEFAICAPVLILMLFALVEFGRTQHSMSNVRFQLEKAGRYLALHPEATQADLDQVVRNGLQDIGGGTITVALRTEDGGPTGRIGVVTATYRRKLTLPGMGEFPMNYSAAVETPMRTV